MLTHLEEFQSLMHMVSFTSAQCIHNSETEQMKYTFWMNFSHHHASYHWFFLIKPPQYLPFMPDAHLTHQNEEKGIPLHSSTPAVATSLNSE